MRGVCPVSYTHLDVYKRQQSDQSRKDQILGNLPVNEIAPGPGLEPVDLLESGQHR